MTFADPWLLLLLLPLIALAVFGWKRPPPALDGGSALLLAGLPATWRTRAHRVPAAFALLAASLLVLALARPQQGRQESRIVTEGIDVLLVVDISSSMSTEMSAGLSNLEVVKEVVAEFVKARPDDRLGLVSFAHFPRTECPLTLDGEALLGFLRRLQTVRQNGPEDGTAIGVALGHAARKLMESDAKSRVVVLLTDGENNIHDVDPLAAAALCEDEGIKVYTIGAGRVLLRDEFYGRVYEAPLDTRLLEQIAETTGGRFFRAKDGEALKQVYAEIDRLEKTARSDVRYTEYDDLYPWVVLPAVLALLLELLLRRGPFLEAAS